MRKLALAFVLAACGGGGSGGGDGGEPITQAEAEEACATLCDYLVACGGGSDVGACVQECASNFVGWARPDAVQTMMECTTTLPCGTSENAICIEEIQPQAIHEEWEARCSIGIVECAPTEVDDVCSVQPDGQAGGVFRVIAGAIVEELIACMDGAECRARVDCVDRVLDEHGVVF